MVNPDCPKDCPRRHPGCQNPDTCESWRKIYGAFYCEKLVDFFPADHYCGYGEPREDGEDDA